MKKFFLLPLFALLLGNFQLTAQSGCTPEEMLPDTVIVLPLPFQEDFPERGIQDTACVAGYYETVIQVRIPQTIAIGTTEVAISQVAITDQGITDLPASFDYVCDPPNCVFLPEEVGCIQLYGEATAADVGMHNLKINVLISTQLAALPYTLPDGQLVPGNYFFFVRPEGSENCLVDAAEVTENLLIYAFNSTRFLISRIFLWTFLKEESTTCRYLTPLVLWYNRSLWNS